MLVNAIGHLFHKYIYAPHVHDWLFYKTYNDTGGVGVVAYSSTKVLVKCKCGEILAIRAES